MQNLHIDLEISPEVLMALNTSKEDFKKEIKLWAAIALYQFNKLSLAKAASLAGLHRYDFEKILSDRKIPISNLTAEDAEKDINLLDSLK